MKCIRYIPDLWGREIKFAKIIAGCEGTVINSTLRLLCRRPGSASEIYGHLILVTEVFGGLDNFRRHWVFCVVEELGFNCVHRCCMYVCV